MATVYTHPDEINSINQGSMGDHEAYKKDMERFTSELKAFCLENSKCPDAGKIISFPVADGQAQYMVLDYRKIIFLPFYDEYAIPNAHARGLRKADIVANVKQREAIDEMFANRNK